MAADYKSVPNSQESHSGEFLYVVPSLSLRGGWWRIVDIVALVKRAATNELH